MLQTADIVSLWRSPNTSLLTRTPSSNSVIASSNSPCSCSRLPILAIEVSVSGWRSPSTSLLTRSASSNSVIASSSRPCSCSRPPILPIEISVSLWRSPSTSLLPRRSSSYSGLASSKLPWSCSSDARLLIEDSVSGWRLPRTSLFPRRASSSSSLASSSRPCSCSKSAIRPIEVSVSSWRSPSNSLLPRSASSHSGIASSGRPSACSRVLMLLTADSVSWWRSPSNSLLTCSTSSNSGLASSNSPWSCSSEARSAIEDSVSSWRSPSTSFLTRSASSNSGLASSYRPCSCSSDATLSINSDVPRSSAGSRASAACACVASHSRSWPLTSLLSSVKPTPCSTAPRIIRWSSILNASALRTSTLDSDVVIEAKSSTSATSNDAASEGGSSTVRVASLRTVCRISHKHQHLRGEPCVRGARAALRRRTQRVWGGSHVSCVRRANMRHTARRGLCEWARRAPGKRQRVTPRRQHQARVADGLDSGGEGRRPPLLRQRSRRVLVDDDAVKPDVDLRGRGLRCSKGIERREQQRKLVLPRVAREDCGGCNVGKLGGGIAGLQPQQAVGDGGAGTGSQRLEGVEAGLCGRGAVWDERCEEVQQSKADAQPGKRRAGVVHHCCRWRLEAAKLGAEGLDGGWLRRGPRLQHGGRGRPAQLLAPWPGEPAPVLTLLRGLRFGRRLDLGARPLDDHLGQRLGVHRMHPSTPNFTDPGAVPGYSSFCTDGPQPMARGAGERPWHLRAAVHDAIGHAAGEQRQGTRSACVPIMCWLCSDLQPSRPSGHTRIHSCAAVFLTKCNNVTIYVFIARVGRANSSMRNGHLALQKG
eukprot:scaffold2633_cov54-Phaeocystis_antarctica.AAC.1